jgi:hypothetical protein
MTTSELKIVPWLSGGKSHPWMGSCEKAGSGGWLPVRRPGSGWFSNVSSTVATPAVRRAADVRIFRVRLIFEENNQSESGLWKNAAPALV